MRSKTLVAIVLLVVLSLSACDGNSATPAPASDQSLNLLIAAEGEVDLKRDGWSDYHRTAFGAQLNRGDQLRLGAGANAIVLCDNLTTWAVPAGAPSGLNNGCPKSSDPPLARGASKIGNTRGGSDPLIPYIISPRSTRLLAPKPLLRWNPVPGASKYVARVKGQDLNWETETTDTQVVYPGEPRLKPGVTYLLVVTADNGKTSQDEGAAGLGFNMLTEAETGRVHAAEAQFHSLNLPDEAKAFVQSQLYSGFDLRAEAIELLEQLVRSGSQQAAVYLTLGDLYRQIGLNGLAEMRYLTAVQLAQAAQDVEGQAAAQAGLGEVYAVQGRRDEAINQINQASASYQLLGDKQHVAELSKRLAELKP